MDSVMSSSADVGSHGCGQLSRSGCRYGERKVVLVHCAAAANESGARKTVLERSRGLLRVGEAEFVATSTHGLVGVRL